jgi:glycosyltransferase involved in cell wall biosynthesis
MRIVIDYTPAVHQRAGIGRYTRGLVEALTQLDGDNAQRALRPPRALRTQRALGTQRAPRQYALLVLGRAGAHFTPTALPANFKLRYVPLSDRWATVLWYRLNLPLPVDLFTGRADLFHGPSFTLPPSFTPSLLTVHDLSFLRYPQGAHPALLAWLTKAVPRSLRRARHVLADSESTRADLIQLMGIPADQITVIGAGVDERFQPVTDLETLARARARYRLPERFILGVSTLEPRKNFTGLIAAFNQLAKAVPRSPVADFHLVIAGGKGWLYEDIFAAAEASPVRERIHFPGFVDDEDLPALYSLATLFAFPSHYEGFGIPVLEAMACGTPAVCADNSSLPEVAGDAALLVEASDTDDLATAMQRLLIDTSLREELIRRGFEQTKRFTWEGAARRLLGVYERLGAGG